MDFDWATRNELLDIEHYGEKARTDRAVLYVFENNNEQWIPISLIDYEDEEIVRIPRWKAEQADLVEEKLWERQI